MHGMKSHYTDINNLDIKANISNTKNIIWKCVPVITSVFWCFGVFRYFYELVWGML